MEKLVCIRHGLQNVSIINERGRPDAVYFRNQGNFEGNLQDDFNQEEYII